MDDPILLHPSRAPELRADALTARLARAVARALAAAPAGPCVRRVAVAADGVDPLAWLAAQSGGPRLYWSGRDGDRRVAGVGAAFELAPSAPRSAAFGALLDRPGGANVRLYGGFRFDPAHPELARAWRAFGAGRFVLPRFELEVDGDRARLACNLVLPEDRTRHGAIREALAALRTPTPLALGLPLPLAREDAPGYDDWEHNVRWALAAFASGALDKVVFARRARFRFGAPLPPEALLARVQSATPGCFHFLFAYDGGASFVGASPERLYRRDGRAVASEAVAGTRPRGTSVGSDARLREELLGSDKDRREHTVVVRRIQDALAPLTDRLETDADASALTLARGRHLYAGLRGTLRAEVTDDALLDALAPTPAVGGDPRPAALAAIRAHEPFDRGWYAGPVGWVGRDGAEFAVAIRSGLVAGDALSLYSGAGIVPGSVPAAEWDEIEHKISDFTAVLGLDQPRAD